MKLADVARYEGYSTLVVCDITSAGLPEALRLSYRTQDAKYPIPNSLLRSIYAKRRSNLRQRAFISLSRLSRR